jgi:hypothetical protein
MKFRSIAAGAVGALFMMSSVAAWAQGDGADKEKRSITPPAVTAPSDAARSATESAVLNARQDTARRAKIKRDRLAAKKKKRHAAAKKNPG